MQNATELKEMTLRQLVELYNAETGSSLKKFKDKPTAVARIEKHRKENPVVEETKNVKVGRTKHHDTDIILTHGVENPKRPGTKAHKNYQTCLDFVGSTVKEFREAGGSLRELNYNVEKEFFYLDAKVK